MKGGKRIGVAAIVIAMAVLSFLNVASSHGAFSGVPPQLRYIVPNAKALSQQSDRLVVENNTTAVGLVPIDHLSRAILKQSPLEPAALRHRGIWLTAEGQKSAAFASMIMANRLTRRDLPSNLWFINRYASEGEINKAFNHVDIAIKANNKSREILFPILVKSLGADQVQGAFATRLESDRPWVFEFLNYAIEAEANPSIIANIIMVAGGLPETPLAKVAADNMIRKLIATRQYSLVFQYLRTIKSPDLQIVRNLSFSDDTIDEQLIPLKWGRRSSSAVSGAFVKSPDGRHLFLEGSATGGGNGTIANRMLFIGSGSYLVTMDHEIQGGSNAALRLVAVCATENDAFEIYRNTVAAGVSETRIDVPAGCDAVYFDLQLDAGPGQEDGYVVIKSISMEKTA